MLTEQEVLKKLDIPDFRCITKDKIMAFASMIQYMDPEVAKKVIEQFPEFGKMVLGVFEGYKNLIKDSLDKNSEGSKQCFEIYNETLETLKVSLTQENLTFAEKQYYVEKMMEINQMAQRKDSENKQFYWKVISSGAVFAVSVLGMGASILGGNVKFDSSKFKLPKLK